MHYISQLTNLSVFLNIYLELTHSFLHHLNYYLIHSKIARLLVRQFQDLQRIHHQYHSILGFIFHLHSLPQVASNKALNSHPHQTHQYFTNHRYFSCQKYRSHLRRFRNLIKRLIPSPEIFFKRLVLHQEFNHLLILKFVLFLIRPSEKLLHFCLVFEWDSLNIIIKSLINDHFSEYRSLSYFSIFLQAIKFTIPQPMLLPPKFQED